MQSVPGLIRADRTFSRVGPLVCAGLALAGSGLAVVGSSDAAGSAVEHLAVRLTSGFDDVTADYQAVFAAASTNLQQLFSDAQAANSALTQELTSTFSGYSDAISNALSGAETGLQNSLDGGWHGGDDGYVFGLFGGTVTDPSTGVSETGSTLQEITAALQQGNAFQAYSYFDEWSLETLDHTLKPLLNPILTVTTHGVTTPSVISEELPKLTAIYNEFFTYTNLKHLGDALMAPQIGVAFGFTSDLDTIGTDLSSGNFSQAAIDIFKLPADTLGDLLNGYAQVNPYDGNDHPFTGLLNDGSLLQDLLVTWPQMLATALGATAADTGSAVAAAGGDALDGLLGLL
ncbi:hypothetical protein NM962_12165 [Mycobacterium sp. SVM_VP21]|nr:hypothetical protein NM962_12165 [Mycobacterium sp. SVM_VP21]